MVVAAITRFEFHCRFCGGQCAKISQRDAASPPWEAYGLLDRHDAARPSPGPCTFPKTFTRRYNNMHHLYPRELLGRGTFAVFCGTQFRNGDTIRLIA